MLYASRPFGVEKALLKKYPIKTSQQILTFHHPRISYGAIGLVKSYLQEAQIQVDMKL